MHPVKQIGFDASFLLFLMEKETFPPGCVPESDASGHRTVLGFCFFWNDEDCGFCACNNLVSYPSQHQSQAATGGHQSRNYRICQRRLRHRAYLQTPRTHNLCFVQCFDSAQQLQNEAGRT
mmetsp:Transcript_23133/g.39757  ORF Transcript_23133/g.39757 Transcript_23133/m.39757 type:complete len:121 (+) Transcript_23133:682-1044(+)